MSHFRLPSKWSAILLTFELLAKTTRKEKRSISASRQYLILLGGPRCVWWANKMSSPREVLWTFWARKGRNFNSGEFSETAGNHQMEPGIWHLPCGGKKWKMRNVPRPPHRRFQIPVHLAVSCRFQNIWAPSLFSFWALDRTFFCVVVMRPIFVSSREHGKIDNRTKVDLGT